MRALAWGAVLSLALLGAGASMPPSAQELVAITARGKALYAYDAAAAAATGAVGARGASSASAHMLYIGRPAAAGWTFDFGTLSSDRNTFAILYRATQVNATTLSFTVSVPPQAPATGDDFDVAAARAIMLASRDFHFARNSTPYDYAAIQRDDGKWYVYLYPGYTSYSNPALGGDGRYTISADGTRILERHRMHDAIVYEMNYPGNATGIPGMHADSLDDVPEDTDVFIVLLRRPQAPDYVSAQGHNYRIDIDGQIDDLGNGTH